METTPVKDKANDKLMRRLRDAVVTKLIEKIEGDDCTSQDFNTAVRLLQNYNIDLETDKEEDEVTPEEQALLDDWNDGPGLQMTEENMPISKFGPGTDG